MPAKIRLLLAPLAAALFLSACTVSVFIGALTDKSVTTSAFTGAVLSDAVPADSTTLDPGAQRVYRVDVGSTSQPALYLYLDANLELYVYDDGGSVIATASSAAYFGASNAGIASTASGSELAPAVTSTLACPGSCVILASSESDPLYVRVVNGSSNPVGFDFFAVTRGFEDSSETAAGTVPIASDSFFEGSLETLGDVDAFETQASGTLYLDGADAGGLLYEAEITDPFDPGKAARYIRSGQSTTVAAFEEVRVYAVNSPSRAAAAGNSSYFLDLVAP